MNYFGLKNGKNILQKERKNMEKKQSQFLNKDITIRKIDSSNIRGVCVSENGTGLTVQVLNTTRFVFVPYSVISEVLIGGSMSHE